MSVESIGNISIIVLVSVFIVFLAVLLKDCMKSKKDRDEAMATMSGSSKKEGQKEPLPEADAFLRWEMELRDTCESWMVCYSEHPMSREEALRELLKFDELNSRGTNYVFSKNPSILVPGSEEYDKVYQRHLVRLKAEQEWERENFERKRVESTKVIVGYRADDGQVTYLKESTLAKARSAQGSDSRVFFIEEGTKEYEEILKSL